jgi:hypothetical protein
MAGADQPTVPSISTFLLKPVYHELFALVNKATAYQIPRTERLNAGTIMMKSTRRVENLTFVASVVVVV